MENVAFDDDTEEDVPISLITLESLDCSGVCFVDITGVSFLKKIRVECASVAVELLLACTSTRNRESNLPRSVVEYCGRRSRKLERGKCVYNVLKTDLTQVN